MEKPIFENECMICGSTDDIRVKRFVVMGRWLEEGICKKCFELDGEEKEGSWE